MPPRPGPPRREPGRGGGPRKPAAGAKKAAPHEAAPPPRKGWGAVARKGTRNLGDAPKGSAAAAFRDAADKAEKDRAKKRARPSPSDEWVDEGPVRNEAAAAVRRGGKRVPPPPSRRRPPKPVPEPVAAEIDRSAGPAWSGRVKDRLSEAVRAYEAERYQDAKRILQGLIERAPTSVAVRELLGLTYYRMGKWRDAIRELGAVELVSGSVDHHPVIADCHRALGHLDEVERLWDDLRRTGAGADVVVEGRIVYAGALADKGRLEDALRILEQGPVDVRKPHEYHLRLWYALAALLERAGNLPRARALFERVADAAPGYADVEDRLESLGR